MDVIFVMGCAQSAGGMLNRTRHLLCLTGRHGRRPGIVCQLCQLGESSRWQSEISIDIVRLQGPMGWITEANEIRTWHPRAYSSGGKCGGDEGFDRFDYVAEETYLGRYGWVKRVRCLDLQYFNDRLDAEVLKR